MKTSTLIRTIDVPPMNSSVLSGFPDFFWDPHPDSKKLLVKSNHSVGSMVQVHSMPKGLTASQLFGLALEIPEGIPLDFTQVRAFTFAQMCYLVRNKLTRSAKLSLLLMQGIDGPQIGWFQKNGPRWVVYSYDADSGFEFPLPSELYVIQS